MKNLFLLAAFMLFGTFAFASSEVVENNNTPISIELEINSLENSQTTDSQSTEMEGCSWCVKSGESTNCATAATCPEARRLAIAMTIDEQG